VITDQVDGRAIEERVLAGLKGFQRKTVDHVFRRMYTDRDPSTRFLVADEVGLGKTLVARGLIAKVIRYLQEQGTERIDIVYICSNADIAAQNIQRLKVTGDNGLSLATRITLLPRQLQHLAESGINFISFTPGTSFNLKSQTGIGEERAVIFRLLEYALGKSLDRPGAFRALRAGMREDRFRGSVWWTPRVTGDGQGLDLTLANAFRDELRHKHPGILLRFMTLVEAGEADPDRHDWWERAALIGDLRQTLARSCIEALEPDLVILDEFQRFRDLLGKPDPDNMDDIRYLSHHLFQQQDVRTLLLSATPYKMYTLQGEHEDDHYADFLKTVSFLLDDDEIGTFTEDLRTFRMALLNLGAGQHQELARRKSAVENRLRKVMTRTERLAVSSDRSGMLTDREMPETRLTARDLRAFASVDRVSRSLRSGDTLDYWKSSPYLLNFMSSYKVKRELERTISTDPDTTDIADAIDDVALLDYSSIANYDEVDFGNARLRGLASSTVGLGAGSILWLPPSLPYYHGRGPYADPRLVSMTKRLVFSSWNVVPDAISILLSYEAERQMMMIRDSQFRNTSEDRARLRGLLSIRRQDGRPAGMSTFGFLYPSITLCEVIDPLDIARKLGAASREVSASEVLEEAARIIGQLLDPITRHAPTSGPEDQRWYWVTPLLLDRRHWRRAPTVAWLEHSPALRHPTGPDDTGDDDAGAWSEHIQLAQQVLVDGRSAIGLGRVPEDLVRIVALVALGSPANCAFRSVARVLGSGRDRRESLTSVAARDAAFRIVWGFRTLFNVPEVMSLLRSSAAGEDDTTYWRRATEEGFNGNLQAVLDEYVHLLPEWLGLLDKDLEMSAPRVAAVIHDAVAIRAANYRSDHVEVKDGRISMNTAPMRVRFALRFGRDASDDKQVLQRSTAVRSAFNSPFWPFVLASTSVGQEGLDFHQYCHAIVHWNLPANPVDMEQREGRVHRYKGHAIRKNVAERHREAAFRPHGVDPWSSMFRSAVHASKNSRPRDIEPFWVYEGSAHIERHVPLLPLSHEVERLRQLRRSMAAYRLVLGQPRQEDLIAYLQDLMTEEDLAQAVEELRIDLSPR
jgi:hypothetical protein